MDSFAVDGWYEKLGHPDEAHFAASQVLRLYSAAKERANGVFLELGTDRGQATNLILAACEEVGGKLVSVDIRDCSNAASSDKWLFVRADSTDRQTVTDAAPFLNDGIDFIYIDSLHTREHVEKEVYAWFDLVKKGGTLFFDDVDPGPYLRGRRKDNPLMEIASRRIRQLITEIFYSNIDKLELEIEFGSTGLAKLKKRVSLGERLRPLSKIKERNDLLLAKVAARLRRVRYTHCSDGSDLL